MSDRRRLRLIRLATLPPLAWCAVVRSGGEATVLAGDLVEETEQGFFEGAWKGAWEDGRFDSADVCCGTGGRYVDRSMVFSTPTDTLQALYVHRGARALALSNSLHLLLRVGGAGLRLGYLLYDVDLMTIMHGLSAYRRTLPTTPRPVGLHYHCNLVVGPDLAVTVQPKPPPPPFPDYAAYHTFLNTAVEGLVENAAAATRRERFRPLSTVSTGYDSPACATLARATGCADAFTFTTARPGFKDRNDSGRNVGAALHLCVAELDPSAHLRTMTLPECEFVAAGVGADDVVFSNAGEQLPGTILFTGFHGDKVWSCDHHAVSTDIVRGDPSGAGLTEFRVRVGFINASVPFFGCTRHPEIHAISTSVEMSPWSVGGSYDRPIPRRIAEEAGVPRDAFGVSKKAVARPYLRADGRRAVRDFLSERSLQAFTAFLNDDGVARTVSRALRRLALTRATVGRVTLSHKVEQLERALGAQWFSSPVQRWRHRQTLSANSALFYWASAVIAPRYADIPTSESL